MLQSSSTGVVGPAIQLALKGTFGSFGYWTSSWHNYNWHYSDIKEKAGAKPLDVFLWSVLVICIIMLYHTFFFRPILTSKVRGIDFNQYIFSEFISDSFKYGAGTGLSSGAFGGILTYFILKTLGVFGCVIFPINFYCDIYNNKG